MSFSIPFLTLVSTTLSGHLGFAPLPSASLREQGVALFQVKSLNLKAENLLLEAVEVVPLGSSTAPTVCRE